MALSSDPDRLHRLEQEARAAAALNHPAILAIHDIGTSDNAPYIVTELLEGETLREKLAAGALSARKALDYALQIARGLAAAHEKGIVHRDLKPENVFVTTDERVKILDFGLAKLTQPESAPAGISVLPTGAAAAGANTIPGLVMGTVGYMSPEQVRGVASDHRTDVFALGAILYEMLAGRRAFRGDTSMDTMSAILKEDPPDLGAGDHHVPPALQRIVSRCIEKTLSINTRPRLRSRRALYGVGLVGRGRTRDCRPTARAVRNNARARACLCRTCRCVSLDDARADRMDHATSVGAGHYQILGGCARRLGDGSLRALAGWPPPCVRRQ